MDNDDQPVGRLLTRREMLKLMAALGAAAAAGCAPRLPAATPTSRPAAAPGATATTAPPATTGATTGAIQPPTSLPATAEPVAAATVPLPACVVRPEQTEGPYFVDTQLNRADIRSDPTDGTVRAGAPLALLFRVARVGDTCAPLPGAVVDIWHCDADGVYSGVDDNNFGSTVGQKFLRGYQVTDAGGAAAFMTIYPGWYRGRTVHIHFKIRTEDNGGTFEFTSQLYFDDAFTDTVYTREPYNQRGDRGTRNDNDGLFRNGGELLMLNVIEDGEGYAAVFDIGLQMG